MTVQTQAQPNPANTAQNNAGFTANSKDLVEVLTVLSSIVHPKETELVKKQVLIEITDRIKLTTVNESTLLSAIYGGHISGRGSFCVNIQYLINLVSKFTGDISITGIENGVCIKSGRSKYTTSGFPVDEFLTLTNYDTGGNLEFHNVDLNPFREALTCVYTSAAKEDNTLSATYIAHNHNGNKDCVVCSNSELGAAVIKDNLVNFPQGPIPKFIVDFILKLKDLRILEFATNNGLFVGKAGCYSFAYRAPDIDYPWADINRFLESYYALPNSFRFYKNDMIGALHRISVIADPHTHAISINFSDNKIILSVEGPGNQGSETVPLLSPITNDYQISVDSIYLMAVLKELEGNIEWSCSNIDNPQFVSDGHLVKFFMGLAGG